MRKAVAMLSVASAGWRMAEAGSADLFFLCSAPPSATEPQIKKAPRLPPPSLDGFGMVLLLLLWGAAGLLRPMATGRVLGPHPIRRVAVALSAETGSVATTPGSARGIGPSQEEWRTLSSAKDEASLRRKFRVLAAKYHPDSNDTEGAVERFQALSAEYDRRLRECRSAGQRADLQAQWLNALAPFVAVAGVSTVGEDPVFAALATAVLAGVSLATDGAIWSKFGKRQRRRARAVPLLQSALAQLMPDASTTTRKLLGMGSTQPADAIPAHLLQAVAAAQADVQESSAALGLLQARARGAARAAAAASNARWVARAAAFADGTAAVCMALQNVRGRHENDRWDDSHAWGGAWGGGAGAGYGSAGYDLRWVEDALALAAEAAATAEATEAVAVRERRATAAAAARFNAAAARQRMLTEEVTSAAVGGRPRTLAERQVAWGAAAERNGRAGGGASVERGAGGAPAMEGVVYSTGAARGVATGSGG
jgi:hypothetical protein